MFSEHLEMKAARAFVRSAKSVTGITPDRVTTENHDSYRRAIRSGLGRGVRHRTNRYLSHRLEQDHRGLKGRYRPMLGVKCLAPALANTSLPIATHCISSAGP
jgi:transposase-like protein